MGTSIRDFFSGIGILFQGAGLVMRHPRLFLLGAIPPFITSLLLLAGFIALLLNIADLTAWMTPFADGWADGVQTTVRVAAGVVLVAAALLIAVVGFTGLTLALGAPLYDKIAEHVEAHLGDAPPETGESIPASMARGVRQSLSLILISALVAVPLFLAGFIPLVGQTLVPVLSAMFGGWMLTIELLAPAFDRRGLRRIRDRRAAMGERRMLVFGFGIPSYLLLAIPFLAVVVFPAATAGGTILTRRLRASAPPHGAPPAFGPAPPNQPEAPHGPPAGPAGTHHPDHPPLPGPPQAPPPGPPPTH